MNRLYKRVAGKTQIDVVHKSIVPRELFSRGHNKKRFKIILKKIMRKFSLADSGITCWMKLCQKILSFKESCDEMVLRYNRMNLNRSCIYAMS